MSARGMSILETSLSGIMMIRVQYHLELAAPLSKPHHTQIWPLSGQKGGSKRVTKSECAEKSTLVASHSFEHVTPFVRTRYSAFSCFLDKEGKGKVECLVLIEIWKATSRGHLSAIAKQFEIHQRMKLTKLDHKSSFFWLLSIALLCWSIFVKHFKNSQH